LYLYGCIHLYMDLRILMRIHVYFLIIYLQNPPVVLQYIGIKKHVWWYDYEKE